MFNNELNYKIQFINTIVFMDFWSDFDTFKSVGAITQLNTYLELEDYSGEPRDLLVVNEHRYALLSVSLLNEMVYETKIDLIAETEKDSNRLSIFDPKTREANYWVNITFQPMVDVINITALVYYPIDEEIIVFGDKSFCKIIIKFSALDVTVSKTFLQFFCYYFQLYILQL